MPEIRASRVWLSKIVFRLVYWSGAGTDAANAAAIAVLRFEMWDGEEWVGVEAAYGPELNECA